MLLPPNLKDQPRASPSPSASPTTRTCAAMLLAISVSTPAWAGPYSYVKYDAAPRLGTDGVFIADGSADNPVASLPAYVANDRVFLWNLGAPGTGFDYFTNDPGFRPVDSSVPSPTGGPPSNLPGGSSLGFQVRTGLYYWDGTGAVNFTPAPDNSALRWYLGPSQVYVTGVSSAQPGFKLQTLFAGGGGHKHMNTYIWQGDFAGGAPTANPAPSGIYLTSLQLTDTGGPQSYTSLPLYTLFNNQLDGPDGTDAPFGNIAQAYMQRNWGQDASGNWSTPNNWNGLIPNNPGDNATFWDAATASRTITVDIPVTIGRLEFRNANAYILTGAQTITLSDPATATISSQGGGSPLVAVPILLNAPTTITNSDAGTLTLSAGIAAQANTLALSINGGKINLTGLSNPASISLSGPGTLALAGTQSYSAPTPFTVSQATLLLTSDAGTITSSNLSLTLSSSSSATFTSTQHLASLTINPGSTAVFSPGINALLVTSAANISGKLDLADNDMILQLSHPATSSDISSLTSQLAGNNRSIWSANGIGTSLTLGGIAGLALIANNQLPQPLTTFDGQPVNANSILIQYTYLGDTNLDGRITLDDYLQLDAGYLKHLTGYLNGDFNYDGTIDFRDFQLIDQSYLSQSATLAWPLIEAHAAEFGPAYLNAFPIPEPTTLALLALAAGCHAHWCRRPRRHVRQRNRPNK